RPHRGQSAADAPGLTTVRGDFIDRIVHVHVARLVALGGEGDLRAVRGPRRPCIGEFAIGNLCWRTTGNPNDENMRSAVVCETDTLEAVLESGDDVGWA